MRVEERFVVGSAAWMLRFEEGWAAKWQGSVLGLRCRWIFGGDDVRRRRANEAFIYPSSATQSEI